MMQFKIHFGIFVALFPILITQFAVAQNLIECSAATVKPDTMLKIKLPKNHGGTLAIKNPKGQHLFIAFDQPDKKSPVQPIMPADVFRKLREMSLKIGEVKGINWSEKDGDKKLIFVEGGKYELVVAPTLETEDPVLDGWCNLHYSPN